ncbi:MAG: hypothetical protein NDP22_05305 [Crenarchaeota archaeon]|nr:hypothetical protein [Thermoproteota archaeon]
MNPRKKRKARITPERIKTAFERLNKRLTELSLEVADIAKFVQESVSLFASDARFVADELALLAERIGELERMLLEKKEEEQPTTS